MNYYLENEKIKLTVSDLGAEIRSLIRKSDNTELMWQADAAYWGRTSPVLFPLVGNYFEKKSIYKGKSYEMGQHGFARDMVFELNNQTNSILEFVLNDDASTHEKYPFAFELVVGYELSNDAVKVYWKVKNTNDETMYFSIGAHPAFNCDLNSYTLRFEKNAESVSSLTANYIANDASGCLSDDQATFLLKNGILDMSDELFSRDALVFEGQQSDKVTLVDPTGKDVISVAFDTPLFGVWSPVGKQAPFVCIEPWFGRCDRVGFNQKLEEREYGNTLAPKETYSNKYSIIVCE